MNHEDTIFIGTSGFSYDDWEPFPYPRGTPKSRMFDCYCEWFNAVEINSTFYHIPTPNMMRVLVRRAAGRITFAAKMSERVTHLGELTPAVIAQYCRSIEPAAEAGVLGAVLLQFPFRFHWLPENRRYLMGALEAFKHFPLVVEIRHQSWRSSSAWKFFHESRINLCITDMPVKHGLPTPSTELTGPIAYLRFHGRNGTHWFKDSYPGAPYDYLYSEDELEGWVEPIKKLQRRAETTLAFFNNHVRGQAPANAQTFMALVEGRPLTETSAGFIK
ncbi:DUF72 domain-containing protein [Candidatus Sumerlaeota bacterium]|nr:DUF72 domain-containing protein [Candidatus Sumerlaeota bacterium]MBI3736701.1 DUF72 domain-containing protein [Candidatus Sumerlaeota bacterium]